MTQSATKKAILLTVGAGREEEIEDTLYKPMMKAIAKGDWNRVVLLPSRETMPHAEEIKRRCEEKWSIIEVTIEPLDDKDDENDFGSCFTRFDKAIASMSANGIESANMVFDLTRGTKVMSAAAALAAIRHKTKLQYVWGERDHHGTVRAGAEKVSALSTSVVSAEMKFDEALLLFGTGMFSAVLQLLDDPNASLAKLAYPTNKLHEQALMIWALAKFYEAWDRLDYKEAQKLTANLPEQNSLPLRWQSYCPDGETKKWVRCLAGREENMDHAAKADYVRRLVVDIWANGRRRLRAGQLEDAVVRSYRLLEMIGQWRLFEHGYDSGSMPINDKKVKDFVDRLKEREQPQKKKKAGQDVYEFSREIAARFLKHLQDDAGQRLLRLADRFSPQRRNNSILIHGFSAKAPDIKKLEDDYKKLRELIEDSLAEEEKDLFFVQAQFPRS